MPGPTPARKGSHPASPLLPPLAHAAPQENFPLQQPHAPLHPAKAGPRLRARYDSRAAPSDTPGPLAKPLDAARPLSGKASGDDAASKEVPATHPVSPLPRTSTNVFGRARVMRLLPSSSIGTSLTAPTAGAPQLDNVCIATSQDDGASVSKVEGRDYVCSSSPSPQMESELRWPRPPADAASLPAAYRSAATQFIKSIQRLNAMTTTTCSVHHTSSLEFMAPTQSSSSNSGSNRSGGQRGRVRAVSHISSIRQLMSVPLLPLTICTDGRTVMLVDRNGTARHHNYLAAVESSMKQRTTSTSDGGTLVLWWTLQELKGSRGILPLSSAAATYTKMVTASSNGASQQKSSLRGVQPDHLTLPYGEGVVLVFTTTAAHLTESTSPADDPSAPDPHSFAPSTLGGNFLQDLRHGYLPSLLEDVYPDGGVQLRGCWCALPTAPPSSDSRGATHHIDEEREDLMDEKNASVKVVRVALPLVHVGEAAAKGSPLHRRTQAAAAARMMTSLQPTSIVPAAARPRTPSLPGSAPHELILDLSEDVLRFVLSTTTPSTERHGQGAPTQGSGPVAPRTSSSSPPPPPSPTHPSMRHSLTDDAAVVVSAHDARPSPVALATAAAATTSTTALARHLTYVGSLLRAAAPAPATAAPAPSRTSATRVCTSVLVLTPMGRIELVAPDVPPPSFPFTVGDVRYSLVRSAVGRSLHLQEAAVELVYGPGTPPLGDAVCFTGSQVVLRLRCGAEKELKRDSNAPWKTER